MSDPTIRQFQTLSGAMQTPAYYFLYVARAVGFPVVISEGRRPMDRQRSLVQQGLSQTLHSKHVTGDAFDIDIYRTDPNDVPVSWWTWLGELGEYLGLRWGGRWSTLRDYRHFERQ